MRIEPVEVRDGDVLVLSYPGVLSLGDAEILKQRAQEQFPDHKVVVLTAGVTFSVLRPAA